MANDKNAQRSQAVTTLANSDHFLVICVKGTTVDNHIMISGAENLLAILKTLRQVEAQILLPTPSGKNRK